MTWSGGFVSFLSSMNTPIAAPEDDRTQGSLESEADKIVKKELENGTAPGDINVSDDWSEYPDGGLAAWSVVFGVS